MFLPGCLNGAPMTNTTRTSIVAVLSAAIGFAPLALAQEAGKAKPRADGLAEQPNAVRGDELNERQKAAVERGLAWLAQKQAADAAFSTHGYSNHAGITSLAGLAFMQAGNLPGRGKYGKEVRQCLEYVLSACRPTGLICADMNHGPMYGHGFATLFLAEVYGMTGNEDVKEKLQKAVSLIQKTQNVEGGWRYQPAPYDADISVTICQVMALRAARDAGLKVEKAVIDKSIQYVKNCQSAGDGGFSYQPSMRGHGSGFGRTAAGVASLYYAGEFEGEPLEKGLKYLKRFAGGRNSEQAAEGMYFYANYYAVQAMFLAGGDYWATFYPTVREQLIKRQAPNGSWQGEAGDDYATAMGLIILQMPNRYLPVYAGKGPGS